MNILRKAWILAAVAWLCGCAGIIVMTIVSSTFAPGFVVVTYVWVTVVLSLVAFVFYGFDKLRAEHAQSRIPEKSLQLLALFGGWPGAVLGQQYFRHKTVKLSFRVVLAIIVLLHWAVVTVWIWQTRSPSAA